MEVEVSEIFYSLEGEGVESGQPTVYIRFARCNKKCPFWNNPNKELTETGYAPVDFDIASTTTLASIPTIHMGCDSQYAVNPQFAHLWEKMDAETLLSRVLDILPGHSWNNPISGQPVVLSLTGGEPTLKMKFFVTELFSHPLFQGCKHVLFETNTSVPLRSDNILTMYQQALDLGFKVTWSNSPKLPNSGETWKTSIIPKIALAQLENAPLNTTQYFKFVVGKLEDVLVVEQAMKEYREFGIPFTSEVVLMPEACTSEQQNDIAVNIAQICMDRGYRFSIRLQNILWGNQIGT